jgi:glutathione S-transferase
VHLVLTLIHLPYSPWSERARWALEHHRIEHRRKVYLPMLGEPALRIRLRRLRGTPTIPLLFGEGLLLDDSFAIARYADQHGTGTPLRFAEHEADLARFGRLADELLEAGRIRTTARVSQSPEALVESLPGPLSKLGRAGLPIGHLGARFLWSKYGMARSDADAQLERMHRALEQLREELDGGDYLLDGFSYADIAMAVGLAFVSPLPSRRSKLGPRSRELWTEPGLCDEFADLVAWRDAIYDRHRSASPAPSP